MTPIKIVAWGKDCLIGVPYSKYSIDTDQYLKHVPESPIARLRGSKDQEVEVGVVPASNPLAASTLLGSSTLARLKILVRGMGDRFISTRD